jgi:GrpB-like predicted nucleotidyltransferase (UPF0157 family)
VPADTQGRPLAEGDEPVTVQAYAPVWPARFEDERRLLQSVLGEFISGGIHHVGSTAVPGLDAPYRAGEMLWFCKPHPTRRTHHLHLVPAGSARYRDELLFRYYLREHPNARAGYARLKHDLAVRHRQDREACTQGKMAFVQEILRRACGLVS